MKIILIVSLFLFNVAFKSHAQKLADSSDIAIFFNKIQFQPISDSLTKEIQQLKSRVLAKEMDQYYYHLAKFQLTHGKIQEARVSSNQGIIALGNDSVTYKSIKLFNLIAAAHSMQKDYVNAIKYFNVSIKISDKIKNKTQSAYLQNNVANIFFSLQDYEMAYDYSLKAYNNIKDEYNDPYRIQILSVLSVAEAKVGKTRIAKTHALHALSDAMKINDSISLIVAHYSLGDIAMAEKKFNEANKEFTISLVLSEKINNYNYIMLNSIGLMNANIESSDFKSAINYGEKGLAIAIALQNDNTLYSLKRNLAKSYFETGKPEKAFLLLSEAHNIFKETTNSEKQEAINDILIKYDTEKKEKELATKNIQILEKDIKTSRFLQIILTLCFLLILLIIYFFFLRNKSKQKAIQQSIENEKNNLQALFNGEEEERIRISHELHDGLASSLTAARYKLENFETKSLNEKEDLIRLLKQTHEETRRIAHNLSPIMLENFGLFSTIKQFADENQTELTRIEVFLTGSDSVILKSTSIILYRFTQEIVQNAMKHAKSSTISINLVCTNEMISLMIEDNGIGFDVNQENSNGGLLSIYSRVQSLQGEMEIDSMQNQGTVIHINLPVSL